MQKLKSEKGKKKNTSTTHLDGSCDCSFSKLNSIETNCAMSTLHIAAVYPIARSYIEAVKRDREGESERER